MEINIILAVIMFILVIVIGLPDLIANPTAYLDAPSGLIVMGGALGALMIGSTFKKLLVFMKAGRMILLPQKIMTPIAAIDELVGLAKTAKSKGLAGLNPEVDRLTNPYMKLGVQLLTEKAGYDFIKATLENDIEEMEVRHNSVSGMFDNMATLSPIFGMIGTIIGLIQLLKGLDDPSKIGPAMAIALITTLYGGVFAGAVWTPGKNKLKEMSAQEAYVKRLIMQGILLIQQEEIPSKVEKFLKSFLQDKEKFKKKK